jgi:predicted nucleic acid-binding protein
LRLADTSAWIWSRRKAYPQLREAFDAELLAGEIATCDLVKLELLYATRGGREHDQRLQELDDLVLCPVGTHEWRRAIEVQNALAHLSPTRHRAVRIPDLLIAAAAEAAGLELLHYDADHELIGRVTRQPMRWLAPQGSLR